MAVAGTGTPTTLDRLLASGPPLDVGEWALTPSALELVLGEIEQGRDRVVECGSGASTIVIARLLRRRAAGCCARSSTIRIGRPKRAGGSPPSASITGRA